MTWKDFTESLTTPGGTMLILLIIVVYISVMAFLLVETGHTPAENGKILLSNAFTAAFSLLLTKLGSK
jgi:hypothetical protein